MRYFSALVLLLLLSITLYAQDTSGHSILTYMTLVDDHFDLYVIDTATDEVIYSIETPERDCSYCISPDGQFLLYSNANNNNSSQFNFRDRILNLETGDIRGLNHLVWDPQWSADSSQLAYHDESMQFDFVQTLYVYDIGTDTVTPIAQGEDFSPMIWVDNTLLFADRQDTITVFRWDGNQVDTIQSSIQVESDSRPTYYFSPDGNLAIITTYFYTQQEYIYYLHDLTTLAVEQLDINPRIHFPIWHPDSHSFAVFNTENDILIYNISGDETTVIQDDGYPLDNLRWSPTGRWITYSELYEDENGQSRNLIIFDLEEWHFSFVAEGLSTSYSSGEVKWTDDNTLIYRYTNSEMLSGDLESYDAILGESRTLTSTPDLDEYLFCWSG